MALLCFLLDLRSISPSLLSKLKQCLLQLANLYVVSRGRGEGEQDAEESPPLLRDRIGLCYIHNGRLSSELKIAYRPGGNFSLRNFHHAVNNLPMDSFSHELCESMHVGSGDQGILFSSLLSMQALYAWGGEDVQKKVIAIGTTLFTNSEALKKSLVDAAELCVMVEFVVLEHEEANLYHNVSEKFDEFVHSISDLENCMLRRYPTDTWALCGLVKRWLQEVRNSVEEPVQAVILFKNTILSSIKQISCNLFSSSNPIIDGFTSCQTCRCHGYPINNTINKKAKRSCPVTHLEVGEFDYNENSVIVGEQTILFLPSFEGLPKLQRVSTPITLNVIERTNLASLDEGVLMGTSIIVTPSAYDMEVASDECAKSELNIQVFHGLCGSLFQLDQGLVCSSTCNVETMREGTCQCFYVLQPSDRGLMLLRRLAGSEEILPIPDTSQLNDLSVPEYVRNSVRTSLSKIELRDYNPLQHERGLHPNLNMLVKESLQFGSIPARANTSPKLIGLNQHQPSILEQYDPEEKASSSITEEWEQLIIIDEMSDSFPPICISKPKLQNSTPASKSLDMKTSRILERLEPPKQQKHKAAALPTISNRLVGGPIKKPLLPFDSNSSQSQSQPLKPNFQRLKRKQK